jgi:hypothetical protein
VPIDVDSIFIQFSTPKRLSKHFIVEYPSPTMSSATGLLPNSYEGIIDGIEVKWGPNAIRNLPQNAQSLSQDPIAMKKVTESMSVACAKRLGKTTIRILYVLVWHLGIILIVQGPLESTNYFPGALFPIIQLSPKPARDFQILGIAQFH